MSLDISIDDRMSLDTLRLKDNRQCMVDISGPVRIFRDIANTVGDFPEASDSLTRSELWKANHYCIPT